MPAEHGPTPHASTSPGAARRLHAVGPADGAAGRPDDPAGTGAPTLEALLLAAAGGDEVAFAGVYDAVSRSVYGTCLRVLRDPDHAAEVSQEVWIEVWRTSAQFDPTRGSARTWTLTLAHRRAIDRVRAVQAQRDRDQRALDADAQTPFDVVSEEVEAGLEAGSVRDCLDSLTDRQRETVVLAYYGGISYREVAEQLELPLPTVKTRIRDGLIRLRDCLGVA